MAKGHRIKSRRNQKLSKEKKAFLKLINQDEPHFIIATIHGVGSVDITENFNRRKAS